MGEIKKIGREYYIEFHARGLLYQQKAGEDKAAAEKLLKEVESKIAQGEMATVVRDVDVDIFLQTFLQQASQEHSPRTLARYEKVCEDFKKFLLEDSPKSEKLSAVTPGVIEKYRQRLSGQKQEGGNLTLILLRDVLDHGIRLGYINDNPTLHTNFLPEKGGKKPQVLNEEDLMNLKGLADEFLWEVIHFLVCTGLRMEELAELTFKDVDLSHRHIFAASFHGRAGTGSKRTIPMDAEIIPAIEQRVSQTHKPDDLLFPDFSEDQIKQDIDALLKKGGFPKSYTFNCLRHTFAATMLQKGVSLPGLCKLMGIDDILQIMIYFPFLPQLDFS